MKEGNAPTLSRLFPWRGSPRSTGHPGGLCPSKTRTRYITIYSIRLSIFVVGFTFTTYTYDEIIFLLGLYCIVHVFFAHGIVFDTLFILCRCKQIHLFILKKINCTPSTFWSLSLFFIFWMNKSHVYCIWHYKKFIKKLTLSKPWNILINLSFFLGRRKSLAEKVQEGQFWNWP